MESISLSGKLGEQHHKSHVPLEFSVPAGTTRLAGRLHTTPRRMDGALFDNLISIAIDSPADRAAHATTTKIRVFRSMPLHQRRGLWLARSNRAADLLARCVPPDRTAEFSLVIECHFDPVEEVPRHSQTEIARKGAGWYRGDLHAHTLHSDGSWDAQGLAEFARARALNFLSLTDHNTVSGVAALNTPRPIFL